MTRSYQLTTLPNGLRVATERLPGVETVAVSVTVGTGARYESEAENGISHLLEHMAFKGTTTRTARDIAEAFDAIGGQLNAYTSMELTVYYAKLLKQDIRLAVDILADILQNSTFAEDELVREKEVIVQEIAMHRDMPDDLIVDYYDETSYPNQPMGRSILSTEEKVRGYTSDDLRAYMNKYYQPSNMVVVASGNVEHEHFVALVQEYFKLQSGTSTPPCENASYGGGEALVTGDFEQLHLLIGLPAVDMHSPDHYALQLYANILGGGMSSRLFQEVREKRGLAYTVYAMSAAYADVGMMTLYAATSPDKAGELSGVLCDQIAGMAKDITDAEIARAKNQQKAELLMARENTQTVSTWIGRHVMLYGEYRPAEFITQRIDAISKPQLLALAKKIAGGKPTVAALGDVSGMLPYGQLLDRLKAA
jgi:predicted Zn-dependent peptidase